MDFLYPISASILLLFFQCRVAVRMLFLPETLAKICNRSGIVNLNTQTPARIYMCVCVMAFRFQLNDIAIYYFFFFSPSFFSMVWFYACVKQTFLNIYGKSVRCFFSLFPCNSFVFLRSYASKRFDLRILFQLHMPKQTVWHTHIIRLLSKFIQFGWICGIWIDKIAIFDETVSAHTQT